MTVVIKRLSSSRLNIFCKKICFFKKKSHNAETMTQLISCKFHGIFRTDFLYNTGERLLLVVLECEKRQTSKLFDIHRRVMKIGRRALIYLLRQNWTMELMAVAGTKL